MGEVQTPNNLWTSFVNLPTAVSSKSELLYRGITSTSTHVTAHAMNGGDDLGSGSNGGLDSSAAAAAPATSATSIENPFASPSAGMGDAVASGQFACNLLQTFMKEVSMHLKCKCFG